MTSPPTTPQQLPTTADLKQEPLTTIDSAVVADEERDTIQRMLDVLAREHAEPRDGFEPVPFGIAVLFGALLAWGGYYIGTNSANFRSDIYDRSDLHNIDTHNIAAAQPDPDPQTVPELMKIGESKYAAICATCHQPNGLGNPGQGIPPLDGSEWVVGDQASPARLARILLYGLTGPIQVKGRIYNGLMPAQGNVMKDYEIAAVLTYIRNSWSNKADKGTTPAIVASTVRAARFAEGNRKVNGTQPFTAAELLKIAVNYTDPGSPTTQLSEDKKNKQDVTK